MAVQGVEQHLSRLLAAAGKPLLGQEPDIQGIGFVLRERHDFARFGRPAQMAQRGRFQSIGADVEGIGIERAVREVQRGGKIPARRGDFRERKIRGRLPFLAPGRLIESVECLIGFVLRRQRHPEVIERLGVFRCGVSGGEPFQRLAEMPFCPRKLGAAQIPQSQAGIGLAIARISL